MQDVKEAESALGKARRIHSFSRISSRYLRLQVTTDELEHETSTNSFKPAYTMTKQEEKHHCESQNIKKSLIFGY